MRGVPRSGLWSEWAGTLLSPEGGTLLNVILDKGMSPRGMSPVSGTAASGRKFASEAEWNPPRARVLPPEAGGGAPPTPAGLFLGPSGWGAGFRGGGAGGGRPQPVRAAGVPPLGARVPGRVAAVCCGAGPVRPRDGRDGSERTVTLDANHRGHSHGGHSYIELYVEECPRPATAIAASSLPRTRETRSNRRAAGSSLP